MLIHMTGRLFYTLILLVAWTFCLKAQDIPTTMLDGPSVKTDTLESRPRPMPLPRFSSYSRLMAPSSLSPSFLSTNPFGFETKEEFAARINAAAFDRVMSSIDKDLYWHRPPKYSKGVYYAMFIANPFLSNVFDYPDHYAPLFNPYFNLLFVYVPGMAPYEHIYSPEFFPQSISTEFDPATGKYKQVMVDWTDVQKNMARSFGGSYKTEPVPKIPVTPVERSMERLR